MTFFGPLATVEPLLKLCKRPLGVKLDLVDCLCSFLHCVLVGILQMACISGKRYGTDMSCFLLLMSYFKRGRQSLSPHHPSLVLAQLPLRFFFCFGNNFPSVPLQVVGIQEVCRDPQRCEGAGRAGGHGEVQPLHVVQARVRQPHVDGGGGRGGVAQGQL